MVAGEHTMRVKRLTTLIYATSAAILCLASVPAPAQISGATTLRIDIENYVPYNYDVFDPTKFATVTDRTAVPPGVPFGQIILIGDIVAVNGTPVKGVWVLRGTNLFMTPDIGVQPPGQPPASRQSIADLARSHIQDLVWEILQPDGTPIGTIMASGLAAAHHRRAQRQCRPWTMSRSRVGQEPLWECVDKAVLSTSALRGRLP
jgi:hypothetical protein